mgnify:FL=1
MDRHYLENATQHTLATAHRSDLRLQKKYNIKILTYWFDEDRNTAFSLIDAPNKDAIRNLHDEAHGSVPNEIIPVDPMAVEAFLGRIEAPVIPSDDLANLPEFALDSAFRAIMYTDLEESTMMTTRLGDTRAVQFFRIHNYFVREALKSHAGREVKHTGDGFMASFRSAPNAIKCAIDIQRSLALYNKENHKVPLHVRIGLSAGEPVEEDGDLFGVAVQLSARLCEYAQPDSIIAAQVVKSECEPEKFEFLDRGYLTPKGFPDPIQIYEIIWNG